jgi:hypothetical protein
MSCTEPLVVHRDGSGSCGVPGCVDGNDLVEAVRRHRQVVNCRAALGEGCPVCSSKGDRSGESGGSRAQARRSLCFGEALVHVDLSLECSVGGCRRDESRNDWLARHADVRYCIDQRGGCSLCSTGDAAR